MNRAVKIQSYRDLQAWQKAMVLVDHIYDFTKAFPKEELFGLSSQLRRSAVSVASNIAELETQVEIAFRREYLSEPHYMQAMQLASDVGKMLVRLSQSLKAS